MNKVIVTTTINPPTEAILKFDAMPDWTLVVAGDMKCPKDFKLERGLYVSPQDQEKYDPLLSELIGWNNTQRRNFAFLWAMKELNADIVATIDDDNIPDKWWGHELVVGATSQVVFYETSQPVFDPLWDQPFWHRGYPVQLVKDRKPSALGLEHIQADVQADFWENDPDTDAICRIALNCGPHYKLGECLASNKPSPFNSQNTFLTAAVMPHYFMFPGIGRMDDIWASYYVQSLGYRVVYGPPSVRHERNSHNLVKDLKDEMLGYEQTLNLVTALAQDSNAIYRFIPEQSAKAFQQYQTHYE